MILPIFEKAAGRSRMCPLEKRPGVMSPDPWNSAPGRLNDQATASVSPAAKPAPTMTCTRPQLPAPNGPAGKRGNVGGNHGKNTCKTSGKWWKCQKHLGKSLDIFREMIGNVRNKWGNRGESQAHDGNTYRETHGECQGKHGTADGKLWNRSGKPFGKTVEQVAEIAGNRKTVAHWMKLRTMIGYFSGMINHGKCLQFT